MITREEVLSALSQLTLADGKTSFLHSGYFCGMTTRDGKVYIAIEAKGDQQVAQAVAQRVEQFIRTVPGVGDVLVTLTSEAPVQPVKQSGAQSAGHAHSAPGQRPSNAIAGITHIIAVASGKGGVGKSTLTANLACALSLSGWKIGVLDADIYGPSVPRLFAITSRPRSENKVIQPIMAHGLKLMSIGFLVEEGDPMIWRGPMVMSAINQLLRDVNWGELDCLLVDMPPGTGDAQLTLSQSVPLAGAVVVSTPQDLALIDARRGIAMFEKVHIPILGLVENMSYFVCPHCHCRTDIFSHGGAHAEAKKLGAPFLGEVPLDIKIRETSDNGKPITLEEPDSAQAKAYQAIAAKVRFALERAGTAAGPKIVIE